jgi:protease IV
MGKIAALGRALTSWYVAMPVLAVVGVFLGLYIYFNMFPGRPQIGVITIPYTVISEDSSFVIGSYLDYANRNDRIKGVVIRLTSPGGGATSSERLYIETRELRQNKPVVTVMGDLVASGGYMMAMGSSHTYAKTSSLVGNVGVVAGAGSVLPPAPSENIIFTGQSKLTGATRRDWIGMLDLLKQSFAQMVIHERGDKLRVSPEELVEGKLYSGLEAVQLGLVDEIGDDTQAIRKAASLAGISNYELVDVNAEVDRLFVLQIRRIFAASEEGDSPLSLSEILALTNSQGGSGESTVGPGMSDQTVNLGNLRKFLISGALTETQDNPLPGLPVEINRPEIYYIYVGQSP